jgi:hypothetical protein
MIVDPAQNGFGIPLLIHLPMLYGLIENLYSSAVAVMNMKHILFLME